MVTYNSDGNWQNQQWKFNEQPGMAKAATPPAEESVGGTPRVRKSDEAVSDAIDAHEVKKLEHL